MLKTGNYPYILKQRIISDYGHLSNAACADILPKLAKWERLVFCWRI
ncbi:MAG: hypothetical protein ACLSCV_04160 [Acutalibacteraceae bacterium]